MCRWLVHESDWGVLSTATAATGAPYGGVVSVSDGAPGEPTGRLLFYLTPMDATTHNLEASQDGASALVVAEAALSTGCGGADPESPVCAKVTALGRTRRVPDDGGAAATAREMLFARHPEMADWPADHGFAPYEMEVEELHLLDFFGGMHVVAPADYFAARLAPPTGSGDSGSSDNGGGDAATVAPAA
jgi:hypothetical protein